MCLLQGVFFNAGHKGESLAKIETAVSLSKQGFLSSTVVQFSETVKNKAVRILAAGHSLFEHDHGGQCDACFSETPKASLCNISPKDITIFLERY